MSEVGPNTELAIGTKVRVGHKQGSVVATRVAPAVPSGTVVVHTILFTHRRVRSFGKSWTVTPIKHMKSDVNYSCIALDVTEVRA